MNVARTEIEQGVDSEPLFMKPRISWSPQQLAQHFPLAIGAAKRKRKELLSMIDTINESPNYFHRDETKQWQINFINKQGPMTSLLTHVRFLDHYIKLVDARKASSDHIDIARAKSVPVTDWVQFNRAGYALCLWHDEKGPSMHYKKKDNKVHCFGCGKNADVIDVVQQLKNCSFIEAVRYLS